MEHYFVNATTTEYSPEELIFEELPLSVYFAIAITMMFFVVIGLFGNVCVIYIVLSNRSMRNRPNVLVASLAVGDLLLLVLHVPPKVYQIVYMDWPFGLLMCKLSKGAIIVSQAVSILSMVALSHDRYRAIVTPMNKRSRGVSRTGVVVAVIWFLSILMACPSLVLAHLKTHPFAGTFCQYLVHTSLEGRLHAALRGSLLFVIPLIIIGVYYCLVARKLIQSTRAMRGEVHDMSSQMNSRKRLAYVVLAIVLLFVVCWLPFFILDLMFQINDTMFTTSNAMALIMTIGGILTYVYSCINPILIFVVSSTYRNHFLSSFCCCLCGDRGKGRYIRSGSSVIFSKSSTVRSSRMTDVM